ncbi:MAG: TRZ/ATZ family hydrolase [Gammaproteobacteria bacterium]|nr:TRZ/ATZ family hydrolase [Gammaproteobacteria bacterium]
MPDITPDTPATALISARWVLPVAPENRILDRHSLILAGERIVAILPTAEAKTAYPDLPETVLDHHALLPGLVNAHGHAAMSLFRGYADDLPLDTWLNDRIWPLEGRWVDAGFVADGTALAVAEMVAGGTTTFSDMYFFPEATAAVALRAGVRAQVCGPLVRFPNAWSAGADEAIHQSLALHDEFRDSGQIHVAFGPHSTYALEAAHLRKVATLSEELDMRVQIHLHETAEEVAMARRDTGERPLATIERCGLLSPQLQAVHMTALEPGDAERLAEHGVSVIHCPQSNLKLASGFAPIAALRAAGVRVALGTDGAASNNSLSMLREMHVAAILAKAVAGDAAALPALDVIEMATLAGAEALGLGEEIGSLEAGKCADMVAIDLSGVASEPVFHPESQLVYASTHSAVSRVWVNGELLFEDGRHLRQDVKAVLTSVRRWRDRMQEVV